MAEKANILTEGADDDDIRSTIKALGGIPRFSHNERRARQQFKREQLNEYSELICELRSRLDKPSPYCVRAQLK